MSIVLFPVVKTSYDEKRQSFPKEFPIKDLFAY